MQRYAESAHVNECRYVCRHARIQTDMQTRIKIYKYHEQYADRYEGGLVSYKYSVRIKPTWKHRVEASPHIPAVRSLFDH